MFSEGKNCMTNNERGGILSKLLLIPAVVVLIAGIFILGYYLGRHQGKSDDSNAGLPPLPEVAAQNLPKPEDFTFYKTLTAKEDKTVSIDLHPKSASTEGANEKKQANDTKKQSALQAPKETETAVRSEKKTNAKQPAGMNIVSKTPEPQRKESPAKQEKKENPAKQTASSKQRYSVQISSHHEKQTADLKVKKMKRQGFSAFIVSSELPGKGAWYRVRVGSFENKAAAERLQKEIRAKAGVSSIVVME
jgi:DedD protein